MKEREDVLKRIQSNIDRHGYHVTFVTGTIQPRFAYTIGCKEMFGCELTFACGEFYSEKDVTSIIYRIVEALKNGVNWQGMFLSVDLLGSFSLSAVDKSWSHLLALGIFDFYNEKEIDTLQILPDKEHYTLDIPDMSKEFDISSLPTWQWFVRKWDYPVPSNSTVVTNLKVLLGEKATEVMRWEVDEWEIFAGAGPDVAKDDMRTVPLAILLGIDKSLEPVVNLELGKGLWRDPIELVWNSWG